MIGYNHTTGGFSAIVYAGLEICDVDLSPDDPWNEVRGTKTGLKLALEIENEGGPLYYSFDGSYSTAFDLFFALARIGHNRCWLRLRTRSVLLQRRGRLGCSGWRLCQDPLHLRGMPSELTIHGGYQWVDDESAALNRGVRAGGEGAYGGTMVKFIF